MVAVSHGFLELFKPYFFKRKKNKSMVCLWYLIQTRYPELWPYAPLTKRWRGWVSEWDILSQLFSNWLTLIWDHSCSFLISTLQHGISILSLTSALFALPKFHIHCECHGACTCKCSVVINSCCFGIQLNAAAIIHQSLRIVASLKWFIAFLLFSVG